MSNKSHIAWLFLCVEIKLSMCISILKMEEVMLYKNEKITLNKFKWYL